MVKNFIDKDRLLQSLDEIVFEKGSVKQDESLEQLDIAHSIALLVGLKPENEYALCQRVTKHLLGEIPEPDDAYLED